MGSSLHRFLRAEEFTIPSAQAYDKEVHLNLNDLAIDSHTYPSVIWLRIKVKQTPFAKELTSTLGQQKLPSAQFRRLSSST